MFTIDDSSGSHRGENESLCNYYFLWFQSTETFFVQLHILLQLQKLWARKVSAINIGTTTRTREKVQFSPFAFLFNPPIYALTCYMIPLKAILFVSLSLEIRAQLKGKIKVEAEKNSKTQSFFSLFFLEWPRARDEKSRGWNFFHFITSTEKKSSQLWFSNCQLLRAVRREQSHTFRPRVDSESSKKSFGEIVEVYFRC